MVRRRGRTATIKSKDSKSDSSELHVGNIVSVGNGNMDQFFTSPRRKKDCKNDCSSTVLTVPVSEVELKICSKASKLWNITKLKHDRNFISGKVIAKTASKNHFHGSNTSDSSLLSIKHVPNLETTARAEQTEGSRKSLCSMEKDVAVEIAEKDVEDVPNIGAGVTVVFATNRPLLYENVDTAYKSNIDNIFLQEPVLKLNVDKNSNKFTSIKINKGLELEPSFQQPQRIDAFTKYENQKKDFSPRLQDIFICDTKAAKDSFLTEENCEGCNKDFLSSTIANKEKNSIIVQQYDSPTLGTQTRRRKKPATPHRILCPSPIKLAPRAVTTAATINVTQKNNIGIPTPAEQPISPSKSQNQFLNTAFKTRRRLNQSKEDMVLNNDRSQKPNKDAALENEKKCGNYEEIGSATCCQVSSDQNVQKEISVCSNKFSTVKQKDSINKNCNQYTKEYFKTKTLDVKCKAIKVKRNGPQPLSSTNGNRDLFEFFPVRRSVRKTKSVVKEEMMRNLEQAILEERADGLKVEYFEGKGRGIIAERCFQRGEFVVEYVGDLISMTEAMEREKKYALDENAGCYMYYFKHKNQQYCIDATIDTGKLGRLVNHSRNGNLITKTVVVKQIPHLVLIAKDDIMAGEELTYDYGDRSKESLLHHPWLAF